MQATRKARCGARAYTRVVFAVAAVAGGVAVAAAAEEVNIYSYRQPQLIDPLLNRDPAEPCNENACGDGVLVFGAVVDDSPEFVFDCCARPGCGCGGIRINAFKDNSGAATFGRQIGIFYEDGAAGVTICSGAGWSSFSACASASLGRKCQLPIQGERSPTRNELIASSWRYHGK